MINTGSNCGGNSAALAHVDLYVQFAILSATDSPSQRFDVANPGSALEPRVAKFARNHWLRTARFLVSIVPLSSADADSPHVIIICDTPYTNVPRRRIGKAPPTYAAGYSDGSVGLLSEGEFRAIDRSGFVALDRLYTKRVKDKEPNAL